MSPASRLQILMALTISLSVAGFAYAHWSDAVYVRGRVKMGYVEVEITSQKALTSKEVGRYSTISAYLSEDGHTLTLTCDNLRPSWFVWVGLVTQNTGTLPAKIKPPSYTFEGDGALRQCFENSTYLYGPYPRSTGFGGLEVWGKVEVGESLQPDGTVGFTTAPTATPFTTDPGDKCVVWICLRVKPEVPPEAMGETVEIAVHISDEIAV